MTSPNWDCCNAVYCTLPVNTVSISCVVATALFMCDATYLSDGEFDTGGRLFEFAIVGRPGEEELWGNFE